MKEVFPITDTSIQLDQKDEISSGRSRIVYLHPFDDSKIIKINRNDGLQIDYNAKEYEAYEALSPKARALFVKCYGYVDTNLGKGLMFERIKHYNSDQTRIYTIQQLIEQKSPLINDELAVKVKDFLDVLTDEKIITHAMQLGNILVQCLPNNQVRVLGADCKIINNKEFIPVSSIFPFLIKCKLRRRAKRCLEPLLAALANK